MKLIIGLGNPEKQYENTRHNAGFMLVDKLQKSCDSPEFELNKKFNAEIAKSLVGGNETLLVKPQTFMNLSGKSVRAIMDFYKLTPDDILVIHDDIDIPAGKYKIAADSSSAGHNGVQDIIDQLGTQKFKRIRIGIGQKPASSMGGKKDTDEKPLRIETSDFVLQKFSGEELRTLEKISVKILEEIKKTISLN